MRLQCLLAFAVLALVGCQKIKTDLSRTPNAAAKSDPAAGTRLDAKDAPYVEGKIGIPGPWADEWITAGFFGKGTDGKRYSNRAQAKLTPGSNSRNTSTLFAPQLTSIFEHGPQGPGYSHVKMPPGDYAVFLERGAVMVAWKRITVKPGDQLTVDLTIDLAKMGSVVITWPDKEIGTARALTLTPIEAEGLTDFPAVPTGNGGKTITVNGVPAGKYTVQSWMRKAAVEVTPGNETPVSFR